MGYFIPLTGQVSFELKTSPDVDFTFSTVQQYQSGIVKANALELNVNASQNWELYVGAITDVADEWNNSVEYSSGGAEPPISILELRFRNSNSTSLLNGFTPISDVTIPQIVIGDGNLGAGATISCPAQGTNAPGDYLTSPGCYSFDIDMKITPGLSSGYKAGLYQLTIEFLLIEDL